MKRILLYIVFLFVTGTCLCLPKTLSPADSISKDDISNQLKFALKLYDSENYYDAVTELKRLLFFDNTRTYEFEANRLIGECYKKAGKYTEAIYYYKAAEKYVRDKSELKQIKIDVIKTNILRRSFDRAFELINEFEKDTMLGSKKNEADYWRGWNCIFNDEWEKAAAYFEKAAKDHPLKSICEKVENEKYSVTFAKLLSVFLPGAGQIYTGNYLSGILSLGWNLLWGYISVNSFIENRVFDGLMTANFLWLRFYTGNVQNAEKFAEQKNLEIINRTLLYLQNNYIGEKP